LLKLWEPIVARQRKYPERKIRSELLQTLAARWERELPETFRLSFEASIRGAKGAVRETRISAGHMRSDDPDWEGDDETGAAILTQQALADSRGCRLIGVVMHAIFSLHALGRRFERWRERDDTALIRDMSGILTIDPRTKPEGYEFICKFDHAEDSGWRGYVGFFEQRRENVPPEEHKVVLVRTWV
jgi:hypothetical protein